MSSSKDYSLYKEKQPRKKPGRKPVVGIMHSQRPFSLKLPSWLQEILDQNIENRTAYIRNAIIMQLVRDGIIDPQDVENGCFHEKK